MKRTLLISPTFFDYYIDIMAELEFHGYEVDFLPDRPSEGVVFKSLAKVGYGLVQRPIEAHAERACQQLSTGGYDLVLMVGGMSICFTRPQLERMRRATDARFVLYLWDSLGNCERVGECLDLFDGVLSFDPADCERCGARFLPLFYARDYASVPGAPSGGFEFDACFVGSVHQVSKFESILSIVEALEEEGARVHCHYYMPSRSSAALRRAQSPAYRRGDLRFDSLSRAQVVDLYARSRTVIDSAQGGQRGLTMRTVETLGARRRLLTANAAVEGYDFYQFGNVAVSKGGEVPDASFVKADPEPIPDDVYESYSISAWLEALLDAVR